MTSLEINDYLSHEKINALSWYRDGDVLQLNTKQFYTRVFNDEMHILIILQ